MAFLLMLLMVSGSLTGCGNTKVVFTTGLSGNQLFKIGSTVCTVPEAMIYLSTFYNQYTEIYGNELWTYDFGGVTLESYVKDVVLSKMAQIKVICLMAEERDITLSDEEKELAKKAAKAYYELIPEEFRKEYGITEKVAGQVFEEYRLVNKVYNEIIDSVELEISDDEARSVTVQYIFLKTWEMENGKKVYYDDEKRSQVLKQAEDLYAQLQDGAVFEILAQTYSDEDTTSISFGRGEMDEALEEAAFSLNQDELSRVIAAKDGFYILKCVRTFDAEATEKNKEVLGKKKQKEAFSSAYEEIVTDTPSQFRDRVWESITMEEKDFFEGSFFEIYEEYTE